MPPPEVKPELTKEEMQTLEHLKKVCAEQSSKPYRLRESCAILKVQQIREYEQKQNDFKNALLNSLNARRLEGVTYVFTQINKVQNEGALLSNALQKASGEYDAILGASARKPIIGEIALTLIFTVLPELKIVGRTMKSFTSARTISLAGSTLGKSVDLNWTVLAFDLEQKTQKLAQSNARILRFGEYLDNQSKDIIEAFKNPIGASADVDAETQKKLGAFNAKNQVLTSLIKSIEKKLVLATKIEPVLYKFIFWYEGEDLLQVLGSSFKRIGFQEEISYDAKAFDLFSDLILYDMLRAYAKSYFVVSANANNVDELPANFDESNFSGLDLAQRKMIYAKFGKVKWNDSSRPAMNNFKDLVKYWKNGELTPYDEPDYGGAAAWF